MELQDLFLIAATSTTNIKMKNYLYLMERALGVAQVFLCILQLDSKSEEV